MSVSSRTSTSSSIHQVLKKHWGYDAFRPMQEDIIHSILQENDTLALMPTGGGKSLCYQVPAMVLPGICLVISPLIALMKDQVENLRRKNITAFAIYSGMSWKEVRNTLKTVGESNCKFLYVSPERLETALFREYLPGMNVSMIAVDEAHCISQWGYDFRPSYLKIASLREELQGIPVLALTASATPDVQADICVRLDQHDGKEWKIFRQSFERANLSYSVFKEPVKFTRIVEILKKVQGSGLVYCKSRKRTKEISELLKLHGISADYYHAGLLQEERTSKQEDWISNKVRVVACTNAFGMGIDKPDVRIVIHADTPDCLENYYQEAGRAGRDGKMAFAVLLYDDQELDELLQSVGKRFPSLKEIREVYIAIGNYLQIPVTAGEGHYYDFDYTNFVKKFKLHSHSTLHAMKVLEQEGWISFDEQIFLPASIQFTCTKAHLEQFEKDNPALMVLAKTLLRAYEGIFDHYAYISEIVIAQLMKKQVADVRQQLLELAAAGIIDYRSRKDKPQLSFLRPRVLAEEITVDMVRYAARKEVILSRVNTLLSYVREEGVCRSQIIATYFGDTNVKACGICDSCLRRKAQPLSDIGFKEIRRRVLAVMSNGKVTADDLLAYLKDYKKEHSMEVLDAMQSDGDILIEKDGKISLRKSLKDTSPASATETKRTQ